MSFEPPKSTDSPHQLFTRLVGAWAGKTRTWREPDGVPSEAGTQGSLQLILDGRFVLYLYQSSMDGEPQHGLFTFGYNTMLNRFEAAWVDSFHNNTAIMFCTGQETENGFSVLGSYPDPNGGPDWTWRTEVALLDRDHLAIIAYNISPDGQEARAVETQLARVK